MDDGLVSMNLDPKLRSSGATRIRFHDTEYMHATLLQACAAMVTVTVTTWLFCAILFLGIGSIYLTMGCESLN